MAQSTIIQRISLEGAQDIQKQLADLGATGERAIKQLQDATGGASPALSSLSNIAGTARAAFAQVGEQLSPLRQRFAEVGTAVAEVGVRINEAARVLGVGLTVGIAGGIAGFAELIRHAAESGHQLEVQSQVLGLTVEQLQTYRAVAAQAGVTGDQVFTGLAKLAQNVGKEHENLNQTAVKLLQALPTAASQAGVAVIGGIKPAGDAIRSHIISNIQDSIPLVNQLIDILKRAAADQGISLPATAVEGFRRDLLSLGNNADDVGKKIRDLAAQLGINFPTQTIGEQLTQAAERSKNALATLGITLKDLQDSEGSLDPIARKVVDGIARIEDPTERARIGLATLGRGWREIIAAFDGGSAALDRVRAALESQGLLLRGPQAEELSAVEKAYISLGGAASRTRDQIAVIFAPALTEAARGFNDLIRQNAETLKGWAQSIANEVLPGIANLLNQLRGVSGAVESTSAAAGGGHGAAATLPASSSGLAETGAQADSFREKFTQIRDTVLSVVGVIQTAFTVIRGVLESVASAINSVFGTNFTASGLAVVLIVGQLSGAFGLLLPLLALVAAAVAFLVTPIGFVTAAIGLIIAAIINWRSVLEGLRGAAAAVAAGVAADFNIAVGAVTGFFSSISQGLQGFVATLAPLITPVFVAITATINSAIETIAAALQGVSGTISNAFTTAISAVAAAFAGLVNSVASAATSIINVLQPVFDFLSRIAGKIAGLVSSAPAAAGAASAAVPTGGGSDFSGGDVGDLGVAPGLAAGGHIRGPGGTDTIPAWLTAGEYVVRMEAVRHYGSDLFHALNQMRLPMDAFRGFSLGGFVEALADRFSPGPSPLMLAAGGLASGSGGTSHVLNLTIGQEQFHGLMAPGAVYDRLARHARSSAIRSAGRKPSWYGG